MVCFLQGAASLTQVFDSAAQLEKISRDNLIDIWNSDAGNYQNSTWDLRSDNKGVFAACAAIVATTHVMCNP